MGYLQTQKTLQIKSKFKSLKFYDTSGTTVEQYDHYKYAINLNFDNTTINLDVIIAIIDISMRDIGWSPITLSSRETYYICLGSIVLFLIRHVIYYDFSLYLTLLRI